MTALTAEALAEATDTDADGWHYRCSRWEHNGEAADGVPSWRISNCYVSATLGAASVDVDGHPDDVLDVCRRIRAALSAFMAVPS